MCDYDNGQLVIIAIVILAPLFFLAFYFFSWKPLLNFGRDKQVAEDEARPPSRLEVWAVHSPCVSLPQNKPCDL